MNILITLNIALLLIMFVLIIASHNRGRNTKMFNRVIDGILFVGFVTSCVITFNG